MLKFMQNVEKFFFAEIRPQCGGYKNLRVRDLPEKKIADPHLPAGSDQ
jgi:hypothetical protein